MAVERVRLKMEPFADAADGQLPAQWISDGVEGGTEPRVVLFRRRFTLAEAATIAIHVSADERYELFLDGERVGRGPERGDLANWFVEPYVLTLPPGEHCLVARTWFLGDRAPFAQMGLRHGYLLAAEGEFAALLTTGMADWEQRRESGYEWLPHGQAWGCGAKVRVVADRIAAGWERGEGDGWAPAVACAPAVTADANDQPPVWRLRTALLPAMRDEPAPPARLCLLADAHDFPFHDDPYQPQPPVRSSDQIPAEAAPWEALLRGDGAVVIPPNTCRRALLDLGDYRCAYPELVTSGGKGALIRVSWAESLYERLPSAQAREWIGRMPKGDRDATEGKYFHGVTDEFLPGGDAHRRFDTLWWEAGRFAQVLIRTGDTPLALEALRFRATGYPIRVAGEFACDDRELEQAAAASLRALQMCSHETFMDCPYYEQLMYIGDTRLQALAAYVSSSDDRLCRKALEMFDASRDRHGRTQSRYPSRVTQHTWGFSLWWIGMVYDGVLWRGMDDDLRRLLPGVRAVLDGALRSVGRDGLVRLPDRANLLFVDWAPEWHGRPPFDADGASAIFTLHLALALGYAAELERLAGEATRSQLWADAADGIREAAVRAYWSEERGLFADNGDHSCFSEHAQCLALLAGGLPAAMTARLGEGLLHAPDLTRCTIYFSHYLFEALAKLGMAERIFDRLDPWRDSVRHGLRCLPEMPEPTRSDCHAWGAHLYYHLLTSVLGIRPAAPGFDSMVITPAPGPLGYVRGRMPHSAGPIDVELRRETMATTIAVHLPDGMNGTLVWRGERHALSPGTQSFRV